MRGAHTWLVVVVIAVLLFFRSVVGLPAQTAAVVDLTASPAWVRVGFSLEALTGPQGGAAAWAEVPPAAGRGRPVRINALDNLEGVPRRRPFSLARVAPREFTIAIPFSLSPSMASAYGTGTDQEVPTGVAAVYLASVGDNWAVYVNGVLVREEIHLDSDGDIRTHAAYRDLAIPFDAGLLRTGENIVAIRAIGDPGSMFTGLRQAGPYLVGPWRDISRVSTSLYDVIFVGIYLFVGIYHLFVFSMQRRDRHYLFYALFAIGIAVYVFTRASIIDRLIPNHEVVIAIELASLYTLIPLLAAFIDTLDGGPVRRGTRIYGLFSLALIATVPITPVPFRYDVLSIWQITALGMGVYLFAFRLCWAFVRHARTRHLRERRTKTAVTLRHVILRELIETPKGNILIGGTILFATGMFDLLDAAVLHADIVLTKYGFFLFTLGTTLMLANRLVFLNRRVYDLNNSLESRIHEVTESNRLLKVSESRYRRLFDGVSDAVALLDRGMEFVAVNPVGRRALGLSARSGRDSLFDCLYKERDDDTIESQQLRSVSGEIAQSHRPAELQLRIRSSLGEPELRRVRLEPMDDGQVLFRILEDDMDPMIGYLERGGEQYAIPSLLSSARSISRRVTQPLRRFLERGEVEFLAMCLNEIVINAVEHGSVQVTFEEKSRAMREERYFEFLQQRQNDPRFRDRRVQVEWFIKESRAVFRVTDEGPGFDHAAFLQRARDTSGDALQHGRGLMMAVNAFDRVVYNSRGNQVTLVKDL